jgi:type IV pilus assembly protein PilB
LITDEDRKFGKFLVDQGVLPAEKLVEILRAKQHQEEELTQLIISKGLAKDTDVINCLADYLNIPFIELKDYDIDPEVVEIVPKELALKYKVLPVFKIENSLTVTMISPGDVQVIDRLHRETGYEIEPAVSLESEIQATLEKLYQTGENLDSSFNEVIQNIEDEKDKKTEEKQESAERLKQLSEGTPVVRLVNLIISQAILDKASDIHIEPEEKSLQVRYRVDGILHENLSPPKHLQAAIISRIKILAELDIAETRVPQDGRFQVSLRGREVDLRVSTLPTVYGENVVLRILDRTNLMLDLRDLGLEQDQLAIMTDMLSCSYGVLLVSGPTGSGKTTTLYSALQYLNTADTNIITVEDPVEYRLKRIRQSQVNVKAGLTFAAGLRSILRQDPDIIMVGEIRDSETAKIAVESALTGHLVLSTIHTNDAPGGVTRLTEMGIEPFLISSATLGVMGQRLIRKLCEHCKKPYYPKAEVVDKFGLKLDEKATLFEPDGCHNCKNTGYRGRVGIYEIMRVNDEIRELILEDASATRIKKVATKAGMRTLRQDGLLRVINGVTSLEEVVRVTNDD